MSLELLIQQESCLEQLLEVMKKELTAIAERDHQALTDLVALKEELLKQITNIDNTLAQTNLSAERKENPVLDKKINTIKELLEQCKAQNEANFLAANQSQIAVNKLRTILFGASGTTTYGKKGTAYSSSPTLGKGIKA
ncbi:flagella synthesis protein FlgN [Flocculibacter collagenilyticus]|uniref:flagella synthesis protein FlgN n=1 Tax=Flocculibacter collagenilyticus TaxID=2744479 RepID=UPI0018F66A62|nr:flagellar protein FlgN [Flocculibacter collagenilyticus]